MIFTSKVHGNIEYTEENIITFKKEIPGFDGLKKFILVDLEEYEPFKLLHSLENENIGFILISPFEVCKDYCVDLNDNTVKALEIKDAAEVILLTTVTLDSDPKKITTNLRAPIAINNSNKLGEQIILENDKYKIKYPLIKE